MKKVFTAISVIKRWQSGIKRQKYDYLVKHIFLVTMAFCYYTVTAFAQIHERIDPATDLQYLGAFRMPSNVGDARGFGLTFYPGGNGGKGSLFIAQGHVNASAGYGTAEISIPTAVNSKNSASLYLATLLQPLTNITRTGTGMTDQFGDITYMPKQGGQTADKLYWTSYQYYGASGEDYLSLGWSDLNFSSPNIQGPWHVGSGVSHINRTGKYAFEADHAWADAYVGGKYLLVGRHREAGGQGGSQGPTLYAVAPWNQGNPPAQGTNIPDMTLLEYPTAASGVSTFPSYQPNDTQNDGVWINAGDKRAVLFTGRKASSRCYGEGSACNDPCNNWKGYHGYPYSLKFYWYDVNELAQVAQGTRAPSSVVPFSTWTPTSVNWTGGDSCTQGYGGVAYDSTNQKLYVVELYADIGSAPIIHVFKVNVSGTSTPFPTPAFSKCDQNHDTSINVLDLQSLVNIILGKTVCSFTCDLNQDGSINILDLQYLANVILGKSSCP